MTSLAVIFMRAAFIFLGLGMACLGAAGWAEFRNWPMVATCSVGVVLCIVGAFVVVKT